MIGIFGIPTSIIGTILLGIEIFREVPFISLGGLFIYLIFDKLLE